jgi:hypothetical protein
MLDAGTGYSMLDARYSMLDARYSMLDARYSMLCQVLVDIDRTDRMSTMDRLTYH